MKKPTFCVMGGELDTGNNGVSALGVATLKGLRKAFPDARLILQTWRDPGEKLSVRTDEGPIDAECMLIYAVEQDSPGSLKVARRLQKEWENASSEEERQALLEQDITFKQLKECDAVLHITGGDSFADIYGRYNYAVPEFIMEMNIPLIWLPQTYGPFHLDKTFEVAQKLFDHSSLIATREVDGEKELREQFNITQPVYTTPDVAFIVDALPPKEGGEPFVENVSDDELLIGLNISGLLYLGQSDFGLQFDFKDLMHAIIEQFMEKPNVKILLVPHVLSKEPITEETIRDFKPVDNGDVSDTVACEMVYRTFKERYPGRIGQLSWGYGVNETWYYIGRCDFFMGGRMHPCIGASSQCVPVAPISYSKKAKGVLTRLGIGEAVVDPRAQDMATCLKQIDELFEKRDELHRTLEDHLPGVKEDLYAFFCGPLKEKLTELSSQ